MKCPKCGFNSFEYLSNCKKCGNALDVFKDSLGLKPLVLAPTLPSVVPEVQPSFGLLPDQTATGIEAPDETFQWDLPAAATTSKPTESVYEEFNLNMDEAVPAPPFSTFSLDEEPPSSPDPSHAQSADDSVFREFSFEKPEEEAPDHFSPDTHEQLPKTAAAETTLAEFSLDNSSPELDTFAFSVADTDNPFGEVAEAVGETSSDAELPFDPFGEITPEELQQKSESMTTAGDDLDLGDFLMMNETTSAIQEEEKKVSTTGAQLHHDQLDSISGKLEIPDKIK